MTFNDIFTSSFLDNISSVTLLDMGMALLLAFGVSNSETTQVAGVIMAGATLIAYIVGEGMVDASRALDEGEANHDA